MGDLKEFFSNRANCFRRDAILSEYPENVKVGISGTFTELGFKLYRHLKKAVLICLLPIALYLKLGEDYFDSKIQWQMVFFVPIHYPPNK